MKMKISTSIILTVLFIGCTNNTSNYQTEIKQPTKSKPIKYYTLNAITKPKNKKIFVSLQPNFNINKDFNQKINSLAHKPINPNSMNFVKKGDVVIDKDRKLMWQDDKAVINNKMTWQQARKYCKNLNLAGFSDWRLPTIQELNTIIDSDRYNPAIAKEFKNVRSKWYEWYWTNTFCADNSYRAWKLNFYDGYDFNLYNKNKNGYVRCVRKIK